ncbi:MAG: hypothetical protein F2690_06635 [Actinobacteria bacterium]|nr:hypothetical protein [Actinomycetota bacterium]MSY70224.1 hypothetical protein [Actinomycetota bacterium]
MPSKKDKQPLSVTHPELAKEADGWDPSTVTPGSGLRKEWRCVFGHHWISDINSRKKGNGCPVCDGKKVLVGFNDLASVNPELAKQALNWDPKQVTPGSNLKREWVCDKGHRWISSIKERTRGRGCPVCNGNVVQAGLNDFETLEPELAKQAFGWDPKTVRRSSDSIKDWMCEHGHQWRASVGKRSAGRNCPVCVGKKILIGFNDLQTLEPELALQAKGWDPRTVTRGSNSKKDWVCKLGHLWNARVAGRANGDGCPVCTGQQVLIGFNDLQSLEPELAKQAHGWDPSTVTPGSGLRKEWRCVFGHHWVTTVASRSGGRSCPVCAGQQVLTGFNDLATTNPRLAVELQNGDPTKIVAGTNKKYRWKCESGHNWVATVHSRSGLSGRDCPTCATSGFDPNADGWLYFLTHPKWQMLQIGITNFPDNRLRAHKKLGWELIELRGSMDGLIARKWETAILRMLKAKGADLSNNKIAGKFDGYSEAWSKSTFEVKSIKELMRLTEEYEEPNLGD